MKAVDTTDAYGEPLRRFEHETQAGLINTARGLRALGFYFRGIGLWSHRDDSNAMLTIPGISKACRVLYEASGNFCGSN